MYLLLFVLFMYHYVLVNLHKLTFNCTYGLGLAQNHEPQETLHNRNTQLRHLP